MIINPNAILFAEVAIASNLVLNQKQLRLKKKNLNNN
jgi:hypothetical protein